MISHLDFSEKGWVSGRGRSAKWREIPWDAKVFEPQFLMAAHHYFDAKDREGSPKASRGTKLGFMDVSSATNTRAMISALTFDVPHGNKVPVLGVADPAGVGAAALCAVFNSFVYDFAMRARLGGLTLNWFIVAETPVPPCAPSNALRALARHALALGAAHPRFAQEWLRLRADQRDGTSWRQHWAITPHERRRRWANIHALSAHLAGLDDATFAWVLRECDHPTDALRDDSVTRELPPKGFWRVDNDVPPEVRETTLGLVAFRELQHLGIDRFLAQNDGAGWMLPAALRLSDHGLGRDDRAREEQPVAALLGPRFTPGQAAEQYGPSWKECEHHAALLARLLPRPAVSSVVQPAASGVVHAVGTRPRAGETNLLGEPIERDLLGEPITPARPRKRR
jgi:hypothetical protein